MPFTCASAHGLVGFENSHVDTVTSQQRRAGKTGKACSDDDGGAGLAPALRHGRPLKFAGSSVFSRR